MTRALENAVRAAIAAGTPRSSISVPAWAMTFGATEKMVREEWEKQLTKVLPNSNYGGEAK